jgi:heme exporter protein D
MNFQFDNFLDFVMMDGHGAFVWASYIITGMALLLLVVMPLLRKKSLYQQMRRQQRIEQGTSTNAS